MPTFQDRLKELRNIKKSTQKQMSDFLDINERTYWRYEAGDLEPNHKTTIKLADYFNVSTDYLLGRSDNPTRH